jgi:hypothetical protein
MESVREISRQRGIAPRKLSKLDLIRALQREEGNFDCFATAHDGYCDQFQCLWREDCFMLSKRRGKDD